jgi:trk/ktr system potassium uptake protein
LKVVIIGGGETGFHLAERLSLENNDVVLIEQNPERVALARQEFDIQVILGEGSSPSVLKQAGVENAQMVVAVTTSDEVNMIACLIATDLGQVPVKVARIRNLEYLDQTSILGPDHLNIDCHINPEMEAAESILNLCDVPSAGSVLDLIDGKLRMISVVPPETSPVVGKKLMDLPEFRPDNDVLVCAVEHKGRTVIPTGQTVLHPGDLLWLVATPDRVHEVLTEIGIQSEPIRRAMIFGGGFTAEFLAEKFLANKIEVKLIHTDRDRCKQLAEQLDGALVLHIQELDMEVLVEEYIRDFSVFVAAGSSDEDNIMSALLAKRLGVKKAVTLLDRRTYNSVVSAIGVDNVVNKRIAAADKILQYLRKGKVQSASSIGDTGAEAIEFEALQTSDAVGKPLHEIRFPKGSLVVGILRNGEVVTPKGKDVIQAGDRVVIIALANVIPKVEKLFQVKVNFF